MKTASIDARYARPVPPAEQKKPRRNWKSVFAAMPVAPPLVLPAAVNHGTVHHYGKRLGMRFTSRRAPDGTLLVWRIE
jgi:hypothetical protein